MTSLPEQDDEAFLHRPENDEMYVCRHGSIYLDLFTFFLFQLYRDVGKDHHTS